jgi:hypothetical protein
MDTVAWIDSNECNEECSLDSPGQMECVLRGIGWSRLLDKADAFDAPLAEFRCHA